MGKFYTLDEMPFVKRNDIIEALIEAKKNDYLEEYSNLSRENFLWGYVVTKIVDNEKFEKRKLDNFFGGSTGCYLIIGRVCDEGVPDVSEENASEILRKIETKKEDAYREICENMEKENLWLYDFVERIRQRGGKSYWEGAIINYLWAFEKRI